MKTQTIGALGEDAAAEFLEASDYEILKRNFRMKFGEIDIIAEKDGCIVFVEVKTRKSTAFGEPAEYVDVRKQQRIRRAATCYTDVVNNEVRFDVIEVLYKGDENHITVTNINHIENAF